MNRNPEELLAVATSVGDGAPLDWSELAPSVNTSDSALVRELQLIAQIAQVHRNAARDVPPESRERRQWGHLECIATLGTGSFGTVYRAHDPRLERDVALKVYNSTMRVGSQLASLFAEGRLLARVRHQNVVAVHGVEQHGDEVGLWLELIDGRTLADEVRNAGPLGSREATLVGQDLCRALAAVHGAGLVHRDVKPQNVMREKGGRIVLMDFGIGRELRPDALDREQPGGTPLYMAPELFAGGAATIQSDIYSLGVLLFFLVTGTYPVLADNRRDLERAHREGHRRLLLDVRPDLPIAFVQVVERACAVDAAERYATAGAMQAALAAAIEKRPTISRMRIALAATLIVAAAGWAIVSLDFVRTEPLPSIAALPAARPSTTGTPPVADAEQYEIGASFYRESAAGRAALAPGARVAPGDRLFLEVTTTKPVHLYIVNQDERGESYLLFPLPGQSLSNPLRAGTVHRLPGTVDWEVTSVGGREHFLIVASPEPLTALETVFARLPQAQVGRPVVSAAPLSGDVVGQLRGVGGLSSRTSRQGPATDPFRSAIALSSGREAVKGPWMRQFVLENPGR